MMVLYKRKCFYCFGCGVQMFYGLQRSKPGLEIKKIKTY